MNMKPIRSTIRLMFFFRSLAKEYENRSVAVILSGTGSDGTNGIRSIKEQNGVIIVQSPESAKFDGMPRNAIATGFVDLVQKPDSIAKEMGHIARSMVDATSKLQLSDEDLMSQIFFDSEKCHQYQLYLLQADDDSTQNRAQAGYYP